MLALAKICKNQILGAIHYPDDSFVNAQELMSCLATTIGSKTQILGAFKSASKAQERWELSDGATKVNARFVVVAAGPWTNDVLEKLSLPLIKASPISGETLLIRSKSCSKRSNLIISGKNNLTLLEDKLQFGSSSFSSESARLSARIKLIIEASQLMLKLGYDRNYDSENITTLFGVRYRTKSRFPYVNPVDANVLKNSVVVATGFYKNGYQLAPLAAKSVNNFITNRCDWDDFMHQSYDQNAT